MPDSIQTLPLFPLDVVLYPQAALPLHIFEQRYKAMIRRCLDEDLPFGVLLAGEEYMADVGCTARVIDVLERYDDGRLDIMTEGEERFRLARVKDDEAGYLVTVGAEIIEEPAGAASPDLRERAVTLHMKLLELAGHTVRPSFYEEGDGLSYKLARNGGLALEQKQEVLELLSETDRFEYLVEHFQNLLPRVEQREELRESIRSNGHFEDFPPDAN
jgi:ATP-dependent Lon protease